MPPTTSHPTTTGQAVVLTSEGRARLVERLHAAEAELAELEQRLPGSEQRDEELQQRARLQDRVSSLRETLQRAVTVDDVDEDPDIVELGDEVELEHDDGDRETLVLVHPAEVDPARGHISIVSPLATALLGRRAGDRVTVDAPAGAYEVTIVDRRRSH